MYQKKKNLFSLDSSLFHIHAFMDLYCNCTPQCYCNCNPHGTAILLYCHGRWGIGVPTLEIPSDGEFPTFDSTPVPSTTFRYPLALCHVYNPDVHIINWLSISPF